MTYLRTDFAHFPLYGFPDHFIKHNIIALNCFTFQEKHNGK